MIGLTNSLSASFRLFFPLCDTMRFTLFMCVAHRIAVLLGQQEGIHMISLLGDKY